MKYISKYSNNKQVSCAQYVTEIICEHKAFKDKKDLHYRFWTNKEWAGFYRSQIGTANKLLKSYDCKAIINALNNPKSRRTYSLRAPHLLDTIKLEQDKLKNINTKISKDYERKDNQTFAKNKTKKNIISKLKDLDNG